MSMSGINAFITGGAQGIGRAFTEVFLAEGAQKVRNLMIMTPSIMIVFKRFVHLMIMTPSIMIVFKRFVHLMIKTPSIMICSNPSYI